MSTKKLYKLLSVRKKKDPRGKSKFKPVIEPTYFTLDKENMLFVWKPGCSDQEGYLVSSDYTLVVNLKGKFNIIHKFTFEDDFIILDKYTYDKKSNWCGSELWVLASSNQTHEECIYWGDILDGGIFEERLVGGLGNGLEGEVDVGGRVDLTTDEEEERERGEGLAGSLGGSGGGLDASAITCS